MKNIVIHQSCARPTQKEGEGDIAYMTKTERGGPKSCKSNTSIQPVIKKRAYTGNQMLTVLAKATMREEIALAKDLPEHRKSEQLKTQGKCTLVTCVKAESNRSARWAGIVPDDVPFTVEGLFIAVLQGTCKPLYSIEGKHRALPRLPVEGFNVFGSP